MKLNNPMLGIALAISLSSIIYIIQLKNIWLALIVASLYFFIILKWINIDYTIILIIFFIIGYYNIQNYFSFYPMETEFCRIIDSKDNYYIGKINGRRIYIFTNKKEIKLGAVYLVNGEFQQKIGIYNGTIGSIKVKECAKYKEDYITKLYDKRENVYLKLKDKIGKRKAGLISAIAFGYTRYIDVQDKSEMGNLGLLHAIAVSGLHMGIIFAVLRKIVNEKIALIVAFIYVIFTGAAISTIRAYIMLLCASMALPLKKNYNKYSALALAASIIMIYSPYSIFTAGFLLSFTATLGILIFNKKINKKLYRLPKIIRESISISISSQIFSIPIIISIFNGITLNSVLGNFFIAPFIVILVILGNMLVVTYKLEALFSYLSYLTYHLVRFMDKVLEFLLDISIGEVFLNKKMAIVYITFLIAIYFYRKKHKFFITLPIFTYVMVIISVYSIFPKIEYLKEGVLIISYKGEKQGIITKNNVDVNLVKKKYGVQNIKRNCKRFWVGDKYIFTYVDGNYKFSLNGNEYLLKLNYNKIYGDYDIIDFKDGLLQEIIIHNDKIIEKF